ncbi:HdeD family acid-resistance protein [Stappia stellulata]|uniref:HdeD family acid-resistance protein n=1 Tax=Stappia stellulata TaxID=71235 RepID=UPI001CD31334|nr:HdeD family acid-resistance protein [Stappia stellulata]MCA1242412.1 HdeD family acid-resistance protein [Stappia stellulata]
MSAPQPQTASHKPPITEVVREKWGWFLALGIALLIGGFAMITVPLASSIAVTLVIAIVFAIGGVLQIWHAFSVKNWSGFLWDILTGIIALVGGAAVYFNPVIGTFALTLVVAVILLAQGVTQILLGFKVRPHDGWGWLAGAGVLSIVAGLCIWFEFPTSALWALGLFGGVAVLMNGWSYIAIALIARKAGAASSV